MKNKYLFFIKNSIKRNDLNFLLCSLILLCIFSFFNSHSFLGVFDNLLFTLNNYAFIIMLFALIFSFLNKIINNFTNNLSFFLRFESKKKLLKYLNTISFIIITSIFFTVISLSTILVLLKLGYFQTSYKYYGINSAYYFIFCVFRIYIFMLITSFFLTKIYPNKYAKYLYFALIIIQLTFNIKIFDIILSIGYFFSFIDFGSFYYEILETLKFYLAYYIILELIYSIILYIRRNNLIKRKLKK